ncbi:hypothetical protein [Shewanella morhuae]|uniref:Uncharacterized protein n=1 Tax=Shewanella morhuae TaxID=365591 RepID=A0A380C0E6_9GAMM|nr:hypothetical protein [Shewanella morhuae]SUJ10509.1 Uncharacterised protein [Shewanella morhuae]
MLNQLNQLKTIGGAERINFSIQFMADNKARVILTSQVNATATSELADLLRTPIVLTGSLSDIDMMLTNELFNLAEKCDSIKSQPQQRVVTEAGATNGKLVDDDEWEENIPFEDAEESL